MPRTVNRFSPSIVSDHLSWSGLGEHNSHDLLPLPFTEESVHATAARIRAAQEVLGRHILVENISSYVGFRRSELSEAEFVRAVTEEADCGILLDVNNLYVNARNHGLDPWRYLDRLPKERVAQIHLAGHEDHGDVVIDTHDRPIRAAVWELYRGAIARFGPIPTLIERDAAIPPLGVLLCEANRATEILTQARRFEREVWHAAAA